MSVGKWTATDIDLTALRLRGRHCCIHHRLCVKNDRHSHDCCDNCRYWKRKNRRKPVCFARPQPSRPMQKHGW